MGPTATATYVGGGGSAHVTPFEPITNSADRAAGSGRPGTVNYVQGYDLDGQLVPSSAATVPAGTSVLPRRPSGRRRRLRGAERLAAPADLDDDHRPRVGARCLHAAPARPTRSTRPSTTPTGTSTLPAGHGVALDDDFTVPAAPAGSLAAQGLRQEPVERPALRRRAHEHASGGSTSAPTASPPAASAAPRSPRGTASRSRRSRTRGSSCSRPALRQTFAAGETHSLDLRAYGNGDDPLSVRFEWVPPDWQTQSIAEATAAASPREEGRDLRLRRRHRGHRSRRQRPERRPRSSPAGRTR